MARKTWLRWIQQAVQADWIQNRESCFRSDRAIAEPLEGRLFLSTDVLLPDAAGGPLPSQSLAWAGYAEPDTTGAGGATIHLLSGVPAYLWRDGCGPTSAGMVLGYWDSHGYSNLIPGDASTETAAVDQVIASGAPKQCVNPPPGTHESDYALPLDDDNTGILPDKSTTGGAHVSNCIADFMRTSWSAAGLMYGWSYGTDMPIALDAYANYAGYAGASASEELWGNFTWADYTAQIDAGRPMVFLVDSDADGVTDHFVPAIGYDTSTDRYACYDTWDTSVHWYDFAKTARGRSFGIYGATFFDPGPNDPPANDNFANRLALSGSSASVTGSNLNATKELGEPNHAANSGGESVWWSWTAPFTGRAVIDTIGSSFDTLLGVYRGTSVSALTALASDDNSGGNLTSRASFLAIAGTTYQIAVDGYGGAAGNIDLNLSLQATNTAPVATVSLPNVSPKSSDVLTAVATKSDADGDPVTLTFVWKVDGVTKRTITTATDLADTFDLSQPGNGDKGQRVSVEVTPSDGMTAGTTVSADATIADAAPTATVALNASAPKTNDVLTATATKFDADGEPVGLTFVWKVNGVVTRTFASATDLTDSFDLAAVGNGDVGDIVTVEVTPDNALAGTTVTDTATVADTPPSNITSSSDSIAENSPLGTAVGTLTSTDPDPGQVLTYSLAGGNSTADNGRFQIVGNELRPLAVFNYEAKNSYTVWVRATDSAGLYADQSFTINVTNVNETPTDIRLTHASLAENAGPDAAIGQLSVMDPDLGDQTVAALVDGEGATDNAFFEIVAGQLLAKQSFDFESQNSYSIRVRGTDTGGLFTEKVFTINVTNVNETPTDLAISGNAVAENQPAAAVVGTLSSTDPDTGDTFAYTLVGGDGSADNGSFAIVGNTVTTTAAFDYESQDSYSIRLRTTDAGGLSFEKAFNIAVTNVNEPPADLALSSPCVLAKWPAGTLVGTFSASDPDAGDAAGIAYALVAGTGSTDNATFRIDNGQLWTNAAIPPNRLANYSIRVQAADAGGQTYEKVVLIRVGGLNVAPASLTLSGNQVAENQPAATTVGTLSATDANINVGEAFTYSLVGGLAVPDNAAFTIDGASLKTSVPLNYEAKKVYAIRVQVADRGGLSFTKDLTINVSDINEAPAALALSARTVAENKPAGTVVGNLSGTDPDAGQTLNYSLTAADGTQLAADNASFKIVRGSTGWQLQTNAPLNYETKQTYSLIIRTTDQGGLFYDQPLTVSVINVNETPTAITLSPARVLESKPAGTLVGTLATTDPDLANHFTYSLVTGTGGADNAAFSIVGGQLKTTRSFDYESKKSYSIRVRSKDQGGLFCDKAIIVSVGNVNERPTGLKLSTPGTATPMAVRNTAPGKVVGTLSALDPDAGNTFTYSLLSTTGTSSAGFDSSKFVISGNQLLVGESALTYTTAQSYKILLRVTDQGGLSYDKALVIAVKA